MFTHCQSNLYIFLAVTKQLYEWFSPSVCPSVTPFWLCSHRPIIMKFSGVITNGRSDVHAKGQGQRSNVEVTEVTSQLNRFRTVTQVWIHIWWWNDAYSLMLLRRGAILFFKVIRQFQGHTALKIVEFYPHWPFPNCNSSLNTPMATKWGTTRPVAAIKSLRFALFLLTDAMITWHIHRFLHIVSRIWGIIDILKH